MAKVYRFEAINAKHQSTVNKFVKADEKYNAIVDETQDEGGLKQERAYDKAFEAFEMLPIRERKNLGRHMDVTGY